MLPIRLLAYLIYYNGNLKTFGQSVDWHLDAMFVVLVSKVWFGRQKMTNMTNMSI